MPLDFWTTKTDLDTILITNKTIITTAALLCDPQIYYEIKSIKDFIKVFSFFTAVLICGFITFCENSFGGSCFFFPIHHHFYCMEQQFQGIGSFFVIFASLVMFIYLTSLSSFLNITLYFGHCILSCPMVCIHHSVIPLIMATKRCCKYCVYV